jgi:hypothetical protein
MQLEKIFESVHTRLSGMLEPSQKELNELDLPSLFQLTYMSTVRHIQNIG